MDYIKLGGNPLISQLHATSALAQIPTCVCSKLTLEENAKYAEGHLLYLDGNLMTPPNIVKQKYAKHVPNSRMFANHALLT